MKSIRRRNFLATAAVAGLGAVAPFATAAVENKGDTAGDVRQLFELRTYRISDAAKRDLLVKTLDEAFVPALNRQGFKPVGVFTWDDVKGSDKAFDHTVFLLIPYPTAPFFSPYSISERLLADKRFVADASAVVKAPLAERVYEIYESSLLWGFPTCPKLETPVSASNPDRVIQLRYYLSHNIDRNAWKIKMFDERGELRLFRECGMAPVFFGEAIFGTQMPNLTYMLAFENMQAKEAGWKKFVNHPEWHAMRDEPAFAETATKCINVMLKPSKGSQI